MFEVQTMLANILEFGQNRTILEDSKILKAYFQS